MKQSSTVRYMFSSFGSNMVVGGSGFVVSLILARVLGPEGKGEITAIILWSTVLAYFFSFGFFEGNVYQAARNPQLSARLLANSLSMALAVIPAAVLVGWIGLPLFLHSNSNSAVLFAGRVGLLAIPLLLLQEFSNGLLRGWQLINQYNIVNILQKTLFLSGIVVAVLVFSLSLGTAVLIWVLSIVVSSASALVFSARANPLSLKGDWRALYGTFLYGLKSYPGLVSEWVNLRLGQVLIAALFAASSLGVYSVAVSLSESLWLAAFAVAAVVFPVASASGKREAEDLTARAARITLILLVGLAIPIFVFAPWIVEVLLGSQFHESIGLLRILLPGAVAFGVGRVIASGLKATNRPLRASMAQMSALVTAAVLTPVLILTFGILGVAVASSVGYGVYFAMNSYYFLVDSPISVRELAVLSLGDIRALKDSFISFAVVKSGRYK